DLSELKPGAFAETGTVRAPPRARSFLDLAGGEAEPRFGFDRASRQERIDDRDDLFLERFATPEVHELALAVEQERRWQHARPARIDAGLEGSERALDQVALQ